MHTLVKGNLHRIEKDAMYYVYCPFRGHTVCGIRCALFDVVEKDNNKFAFLHCCDTQYAITDVSKKDVFSIEGE